MGNLAVLEITGDSGHPVTGSFHGPNKIAATAYVMIQLPNSVVTTSSTFSFTFRIAGIMAQPAPPKKPTTSITGMAMKDGIEVAYTAKNDANNAPEYSCPSAPIFQNLHVKAKATERPHSSKGANMTKVSV